MMGGDFMLNWRKFPVGIWWTYWPCFVCSIAIEFGEKLVRWLMERMRYFYENLAMRFRVKGKK